jgi:hypothetical protein
MVYCAIVSNLHINNADILHIDLSVAGDPLAPGFHIGALHSAPRDPMRSLLAPRVARMRGVGMVERFPVDGLRVLRRAATEAGRSSLRSYGTLGAQLVAAFSIVSPPKHLPAFHCSLQRPRERRIPPMGAVRARRGMRPGAAIIIQFCAFLNR